MFVIIYLAYLLISIFIRCKDIYFFCNIQMFWHFFSYDMKIVLFSFVFSAKIITFARKRQDNEIFHHTKL